MEIDTVVNVEEKNTLKIILEQIDSIKNGVANTDKSLLIKTLRSIPALRKQLTESVFHDLIDRLKLEKPNTLFTSAKELSPEIECYINMLGLIHLMDSKSEVATTHADLLIQRIVQFNRRTLDAIAAKCLYFCSVALRQAGKLCDYVPLLSKRLTVATQKNDVETQSVLINIILMHYLDTKAYHMANKFANNVTFPADANNNETSRFLYYQGRIKAVQLDYSGAQTQLVSAIRKAPQHSALSFRQTLHKFDTVVKLLIGEIPDRTVFRQPELKSCLTPYFKLSQAVQTGDLSSFNEVLENYEATFIRDKTHSLIVRLRHNVLKAGLRRICQSYSTVSLDHITRMLQLENKEDTVFIVAKAIKDGVITGVINNEHNSLTVDETSNVYSSVEPFNQFATRTSYCNNTRNDCVKAMRYSKKKFSSDTKKDSEISDEDFEDSDDDMM